MAARGWSARLVEGVATWLLRVLSALLGAISGALLAFAIYAWGTLPGATLLVAVPLALGVLLSGASALAAIFLPRQSRRFVFAYVVFLRFMLFLGVLFAILFVSFSGTFTEWSKVLPQDRPLVANITYKLGVGLFFIAAVVGCTLLAARRVYVTLSAQSSYIPVGGGGPVGAGSPSTRRKKPTYAYGALDDIYGPGPAGAQHELGALEEGDLPDLEEEEDDDIFGRSSARARQPSDTPPRGPDRTRPGFGASLDNSLFDSRSGTDSPNAVRAARLDDEAETSGDEAAIRSRYAELYKKYSLS